MAKNRASRGEVFVSAAQIRAAMTLLMPELSGYWRRPLTDYAHAAYDTVETGRCSVRNDAMGRLQALVKSVALRSGASEDQALDAARQISELPVIQSGPHCFLMVDAEAFYTHLFSALGLSSHRRRWHIYFGCSTVKFIETANKGPGWLDTGGALANVFGLSRRRMSSTSLCGRNGPYQIKLEPDEATSTNHQAEWLKEHLPDASFPTAAEAIMAANQVLWRRSFPLSLQLLQFNDMDVGDLIADHFEDPDSWLSRRFIGEGMVAEKILGQMVDLNAAHWAGWIRRTTDFFWGILDGRIVPLHLHEGILFGSAAPGFTIPFNPEAIARALRQRRLVPNLMMMALVTSILPGVRLLGGSRQTVYYPLMRYLVGTSLDAENDRALLVSMRHDRRTGMWGHRVLKPASAFPLLETEYAEHGLAVAAAYGEQTLEEAAGDLSFFTCDPIWTKMCRHLENGEITARSPQWEWA